jgi:hypothetical protein
MMVDLTGELAATRASTTEEERAKLAKLGIPQHMLDMVGAARVDLFSGGKLYQPLEDIGDRVFIIGVRVGDPISPEHPRPDEVAYCGILIDLLAWHPDVPERWATRLDLATWLGAIPPQYMQPPKVLVHRTPLAWLQSGGRGLCILTREPREAQSLLLSLRGGIIPENDGHGRKLKRLLERPFPIPPIHIPRNRKQAGAT